MPVMIAAAAAEDGHGSLTINKRCISSKYEGGKKCRAQQPAQLQCSRTQASESRSASIRVAAEATSNY